MALKRHINGQDLTFGDIYWNGWSICWCVGPVEKFEDVVESHRSLVTVIEKYPDLKKEFNMEMVYFQRNKKNLLLIPTGIFPGNF